MASRKLPDNSIGYEYRACVRDSGDLTSDRAGPFPTRAEARVALRRLLDAEPPYDEGWIERRPRVDWERVNAC